MDDALVAEARRVAGTRTASAAVNAALREFVRNRGENAKQAEEQTDEQKRKATSGSWDALEALTREMREGGWEGYDYKEYRRGQRFD